MFILMASPVIKLCCSDRLLSSSLQSSEVAKVGLTTLSSGVVTGFVRTYASVNFVFLVSWHFPFLLHTCHLMELGRLNFRGQKGSVGRSDQVSRLLQVLTLIRKSGILAPILRFPLTIFQIRSGQVSPYFLRSPPIQNQLECR